MGFQPSNPPGLQRMVPGISLHKASSMTQPRRFLPLLGALMGVFCVWVQAQSVDVVRTADLRFGSMVVVSHGTQAINPQTGLTSGTAHVLRPSSLANSVGAAEFVVTCTSSSYPVVYTLAITSPSTRR